MISEDWYWKKPLREISEKLRKAQTIPAIPVDEFCNIERDIFIGFFSIRKLIDAQTKITDALRTTMFALHHVINIKNVEKFAVDFTTSYNFSNAKLEQRDVVFIANQMIHSHIFQMYAHKSGPLKGVMFTSDRDFNKKLYIMPLSQMCEIFDLFGNNAVTRVEWIEEQETIWTAKVS
jgi:hypothetical protein